MNLTTFRARVAGSIGLDNNAGSEEQALIDGWVNEGIEQFLLDTGMKVALGTITTTAGEGDYDLPDEVLALRKVWIDDTPDWILEPVSEDDILWFRRAEGIPLRYYSIAGANLLQLAGIPDSASTINITYVPRPVTLVNGSDEPTEIPAEYHPVPEAYAKWKAADYDDDTSSEVGRRYFEEYAMGVKKAVSRMNRRGGRMLSPVRPGRRRPRRWGVSNGTDLG